MSEKNEKHLTVLSVLMVRLRFVMIFVVVGLLVAKWDWITAQIERRTRPAKVDDGVKGEFEFYCPMHPSVVRAEAGSCPICGMGLSRRKRGEKEVLSAGILGRLQLSPFRIQQAGVATVEVKFQTLVREIRAVGFVEYDERRYKHISARIAGRADELYVNYVGVKVKAGDPVYSLYSPDLVSTEKEYLLAQQAVKDLEPKAATAGEALAQARHLADSARERMKLWGIADDQIALIDQSGKPQDHVTIYSPISGTVIEKDIHQGHYVQVGEDPYTIVDDTVVWLQAEVFERDLGAVDIGQEVSVTTEAWPGEAFVGTVAFIYPTLSTETRTVKVRVEIPNPDGKLRPGMYATSIIRIPAGKHGEVIYTCCEGCGTTADHESKCPTCSKAMVKRGGIAETPADAKEAYYPCPMHPEVVSNEPGTCPKCGKNLERRERDPVAKLAEFYTCPMPIHLDVQSASPGVCGKCGMDLEKRERKGGADAPAAGGTSHVVEAYVCPLHPIRTADGKLQCPECHCEMRRLEFEQILAVPLGSVIDTGEHKVVYVDRGRGTFEAVEVHIGLRAGEYYPILAGLKEGDRIVTAGAFLLDAETRLNPAAASAYFGASGQDKK